MRVLENDLLAILPRDGTPVTNRKLREQLKWEEEDYWRTRNQLVAEGKAIRLPGRGGRTARLVVNDLNASDVEYKARWWLLAATWFCWIVTIAVVVGAMIYPIRGRGDENWTWNWLALPFGAFGVAAIGVALVIFRSQEEASHRRDQDAREAQAHAALDLREVKASIEDVRAEFRAMSVGSVLDAPEGEAEADSDDAATGGLSDDSGALYPPRAVPLKVISNIVVAWERGGERGGWTIENLVGGYRPFNRSGNLTGAPWLLTFEDLQGNRRTFKLTTTGRRGEPNVSERTEGGGWHALP